MCVTSRAPGLNAPLSRRIRPLTTNDEKPRFVVLPPGFQRTRLWGEGSIRCDGRVASS